MNKIIIIIILGSIRSDLNILTEYEEKSNHKLTFFGNFENKNHFPKDIEFYEKILCFPLEPLDYENCKNKVVLYKIDSCDWKKDNNKLWWFKEI